ncbi:response regulator [bacterium]|nr:response regulator [bacterium]
MRKFTTRILEKAKYTHFQATDGDDALTIYGAHADEIQMLVLDVMMPGMTGPDIYTSFHKSRSDIPVLFCLGYGTVFLRKILRVFMRQNCCKKPFSPDQLLLEVDNLLSQNTNYCQ